MNNYRAFCKIMGQAVAGDALVRVPEKYHNLNALYQRFLPLLNRIKDAGFKRGLDFGCGMSVPTVLGRLLGLNIVGLDLDYQIESDVVPGGGGECSYSVVQRRLVGMGFPITNWDTNKTPYPFQDDSFDFICAYWGAGMPPTYVAAPSDCRTTRQAVALRAVEFVRVTRPNGMWFLHPVRDWRLFAQSEAFVASTKGIVVVPWSIRS